LEKAQLQEVLTQWTIRGQIQLEEMERSSVGKK